MLASDLYKHLSPDLWTVRMIPWQDQTIREKIIFSPHELVRSDAMLEKQQPYPPSLPLFFSFPVSSSTPQSLLFIYFCLSASSCLFLSVHSFGLFDAWKIVHINYGSAIPSPSSRLSMESQYLFQHHCLCSPLRPDRGSEIKG